MSHCWNSNKSNKTIVERSKIDKPNTNSRPLFFGACFLKKLKGLTSASARKNTYIICGFGSNHARLFVLVSKNTYTIIALKDRCCGV